MPVRWTKYKYNAFSPGNPSQGNFYDEMRLFGRDQLDDLYYRFLIDIQYGRDSQESELLGAISEEYWTMYFNRINNDKGYDLAVNYKFNPIVGDLFGSGEINPNWIDLDLSKLDYYMRRGFARADAAYLLGVSHDTINRRLISLGTTYEKRQIELIEPIIMSMYEQGLGGHEMSQYFARLDIERKDIFTVEKIEQLKSSSQYIEVINYNPLEMDYFLKIVLIDCFKENMDTYQISNRLRYLKIKNINGQYYTPNTITLLVQRLFEGKKLFEMRHAYVEPLLEHLLRTTNYGARKITYELGWCDKNDPLNIKQSMQDRLMAILESRYGFKKITDARNFFKDHYLGYHDYDKYYLY